MSNTPKKRTRRWNSSYRSPSKRGWYECKARDDRWEGGTEWRAWGQGCWWVPLGGDNAEGGWLSSPMGIYQWRGPRIDINKPKPAALRHSSSIAALGREHADREGK